MQSKEMALFSHLALATLVAVLFFRWLCKRQKGKLHLHLFFHNLNIEGEFTMVQIKVTQSVSGMLKPVDSKGNAAAVEPGSVKFESSNEEVFVVEQDATHETKLKVVPKGPGVASLRFSADADLGDGVKTISGETGVEVIAGDAVGFGIEFSAPVDEEAAAPVEETQPPVDENSNADNADAPTS